MTIVGQFAMIEGSANRLDTEQEREQEQEQEKEVEARRDQQIEIEKFVEREYSRQEEAQRPWPLGLLGRPVEAAPDYPFYKLKDFKLRHHEPMVFHDALFVSSNYFNSTWSGLRRIKNVVMVRNEIWKKLCKSRCMSSIFECLFAHQIVKLSSRIVMLSSSHQIITSSSHRLIVSSHQRLLRYLLRLWNSHLPHSAAISVSAGLPQM